MSRKRRSKCLCCNELFTPDYRNRGKQKYCAGPACQKASKRASQQKWLSKNPDYFKGSANVQRVREWRARNPGKYKNRSAGGLKRSALQDDCTSQITDSQREELYLREFALQDDCKMQPVVLLGLISHLTSGTLQEDIVENLQNLHKRGEAILGTFSGTNYSYRRTHNEKANIRAGAAASNTTAVQLGRSPPGERKAADQL